MGTRIRCDAEHGLPADSGFESDEEEAKFEREVDRLAEQLRNERGPEFTVTVHV